MQVMVSNMTAEANTCMGGAAGRSRAAEGSRTPLSGPGMPGRPVRQAAGTSWR